MQALSDVQYQGCFDADADPARRRDVRVPISQGYELYNALNSKACQRDYRPPASAHGPIEPKMQSPQCRALEWFDKYLEVARALIMRDTKSH